MRFSKLLTPLLWLTLTLPAQAQLLTTGAGPGGTFTAGCSAATTFLARVSNFSEEDQTRYSKAICSLVTSGTFAKLDALYILAAPNQSASLLNLISTSYSLTTTGTLTFGANAGWTGDGATGFLNTNFTPSTAGGNYTTTSNSLGVGISDPRQALGDYIAIGSGTFGAGAVIDYITVGCVSAGNCDAGSGLANQFTAGHGEVALVSSTTPTVFNGAWMQSWNSGTLTAYYNGTLLGAASGTYPAANPYAIYILALNFAGTAGENSPDTVTWAFIGGTLTQADITALTNALSIFPITNAPPAAIAQGYSGHSFTYNFATQGLTGIDVNGTNTPGYQLYTSWWFGCYAGNLCENTNAPASSYTYTAGSYVTMGGNGLAGRLGTAGDTQAGFVVSGITGTTMTVTSVLYRALAVGQVVAGNAALTGQTIVAQLAGTPGGAGLYQLSSSASLIGSANLTGNSHVGLTFPPGGFYEAQINTTTAGQPTNANYWPAVWMKDVAGLQASNFNTGFGTALEFGELDIWEAPNSNDPNSDMNVLDWININGGTGPNNLGNSNDSRQDYPAVTNPTATHYFGMLWVPSAKNSGTGLLQFYLDRVHITGKDVSYTASGTPTPACLPSNPAGCLFTVESGNFNFLLNSGGKVPGGTFGPYPVNLIQMDVWH